MVIERVYQTIFEQLQDLKTRLEVSNAQLTDGLEAVIKGAPVEAPLNGSEADIDVLYRMVWALQIREIAFDKIALVTNAMRLDVLRAGGMSLEELSDDLSASARCHGVWLFGSEDPVLVKSWLASANATSEVLAFSGADLRLLVDGPMGDWRGDERAERWREGSSQRVQRLLERGDLRQDYLSPDADDLEAQICFAMRLNAHGLHDEAIAVLDGPVLGLNAGRAHQVKARLFRQRGLGQEAVEASTAAIGAGIAEPGVEYYNRGVDFTSLGELDRAIEDFAAAIELDGTWADPYRNLGCLLMRRGDHEVALVNLEKTVELEPNEPTHHYNLSLVLGAQDQEALAVEALNTALELDDDFAAAYNNRGILRRSSGDLEGAIEDFSASLLRQDDITALINRADTRLQLGGEELEAAAQDYSTLLQHHPDDLEFLANRAQAFEQVGRRAQAITDYVQILREADEGAAQIELATAGLERLDYGGPRTHPWPESPTIASMKATRDKIDPEVWEAAFGRAFDAQDLWRTQGAEAALPVWDEVIEAIPSCVEPWVRRGLMWLELDHPDKALSDIERALALDSGADLPYAALSDVFARSDDTERALKAIEEAITRSPWNTDYQARRASLLENQGDVEAAIEAFRGILVIEPANHNALYNMACATTTLGLPHQAIEIYSQLLHIAPDDTQVLLNRGALLLEVESVEAAFEDWKRASTIDPWYAFPYAKRGVVHLTEGRTWHAVWELLTALVVAPEGWPFFEATQTTLHIAADALNSAPLPKADFISHIDRLHAINAPLTFNFLRSIKPLAQEESLFWRLFGDTLFKMDSEEDAHQAWTQALALDPCCAAAHIGLARQALSQGDTTCAIEHLQKALEHRSLHDTWERRGTQSDLAHALVKANRPQEAFAVWESMLSDDPNDTDILFALAFQQNLAGLREASIQTYTRLIELNPEHSTAWFNRACGHGILGHSDEAIADLTQAIALDESWRAKAMEDTYFDPIREALNNALTRGPLC